MIELSCSSKRINSLFDPESLWTMLVKRDYPNSEFNSNELNSDSSSESKLIQMSYYEIYVQEYINRNVTTYIGVSYNTEYEDRYDRLLYIGDSPVNNYEDMRRYMPRFLTKDDTIEYLWERCLSQRGILKRYYQLKQQSRRLLKVFGHRIIMNILNSEKPLLELIEFCDFGIQDFLYDEDISYRECLDLMEDYLDEFNKYKDVVCSALHETSVSEKTGMCGWDIYKIEKRRGIREYADDEKTNTKPKKMSFEEWMRAHC